MRIVRCWAAMLIALFLVGACTDSPTLPGGQSHPAGSAPRAVSCVDPVCNPPEECDPWLDLDWCEESGGGECIESVGVTGPGSIAVESLSGCTGENPPAGGGSTPATPPPPDSCKTSDPVLDSPQVFLKFDALWRKSVLYGIETGGWIVSTSSGYQLVSFGPGVNTSCGIDVYQEKPAGAVALVHTHPFHLGDWHDCGDGARTLYTGTPSGADTRQLQLLGLTQGYFLDYNGIGRYTPTGGEQATRIDRCAY
jgi:hypothetical protein